MKLKVKRVDSWIEVYLPHERDKRKKWTYAIGFVDKNDTLIITDVYVRPSLRKGGLGGKMVNTLIEVAGCSKVRANNIQPKAVGFWNKLQIEEIIDGRVWPRIERERKQYFKEEGYL